MRRVSASNHARTKGLSSICYGKSEEFPINHAVENCESSKANVHMGTHEHEHGNTRKTVRFPRVFPKV